MPRYGWYGKNSGERAWPVGIRKPNDLGLFDMHGTVWTWCQETFAAYSTIKDGETIEDKEDIYSINDQNNRVFRGGSFGYQASLVRSAFRINAVPSYRDVIFGFRLARTLPHGSFTALPPTAEDGRK